MEATQAQVQRWEAVPSEYRQRLETLSLTLQPLRIDDSAPQTSTQGESGVYVPVAAIAALAHTSQWPARQAARKQVKKPVPALAALVDFWWAGVRQDLEHAAVSPIWRPLAQESLWPKV
jgi:hypothetical protein